MADSGPGRAAQLTFLVSNFLVIGLGFGINIGLTHWMSTADFGRYRYISNFCLMIPSLLGLGINFSVARLVAVADAREESGPVIAAGLALAFGWGLVISAALAVLAHPWGWPWGWATAMADNLRQVRLMIPFVGIFMLQVTVNAAYQGLGRVLSLALFNLIPSLTIIVGCLVWILVWPERPLAFGFVAALFLGGTCLAIVPRVAAVGLRGLRSVSTGARRLVADVNQVGKYIYISAIFGTAITTLMGLLLGGVYGFEDYAHYSLAISLGMLFSLGPSSLAMAQFRRYANSDRIPGRDLALVLGLAVGMLLMFALLADVAFFWVFPERFAPALLYLKVLAVAYTGFGISEYVNRFLMAKGLGREIMRISIATGVLNLGLSALLGWWLELIGLAVAAVAVAVLSVTLYSVTYRRFRSRGVPEQVAAQ